jgi:YVTN family beta-propeller protein
MRTRIPLTLFVLASLMGGACEMNPAGGGTVQPVGAKAFINFETIPTRPLALSPDGTRLFVTNVPDSRLEILRVTAQGLTLEGSVTVGLDPIAVAARTNNEVWVVNHVSDSVSVVDVTPGQVPRITRTLLVGDEPRDIVFAGTGGNRAFISTARRGQNYPEPNPREITQVPGQGRGDVWVFDATSGNRVGIVTTFSDKLGSLGVSNDGTQVIVAAASSGNGTAVITGESVCGTNGMTGRAPTVSCRAAFPLRTRTTTTASRLRASASSSRTTGRRRAAAGSTGSAANGTMPFRSASPTTTCSRSTRTPWRSLARTRRSAP